MMGLALLALLLPCVLVPAIVAAGIDRASEYLGSIQ